jgi:hypothetical protein
MTAWSRLSNRFAAAAGVILTGGVLVALPVAATAQPMRVAVAVEGSIPGISDADLPALLAKAMNEGVDSGLRFEPVAPGAPMPPDRIEWSITTNASAEGTVRTYGFSRATMQRLMGVHQFLSIEVTLFLGGQYQTQSHSEVAANGSAQDPDLMADVVRSTRQLVAYTTLDTSGKIPPARQ